MHVVIRPQLIVETPHMLPWDQLLLTHKSCRRSVLNVCDRKSLISLLSSVRSVEILDYIRLVYSSCTSNY